MLVFTRKIGQSLMIGDEVEIKVVSMGNDQVRIGIEAPRRIPVHRREVYEAILGGKPKSGNGEPKTTGSGKLETRNRS